MGFHDLTKGQKRALRAAAELASQRDRTMTREDADEHYLDARNADLPIVVGGAIAHGIISIVVRVFLIDARIGHDDFAGSAIDAKNGLIRQRFNLVDDRSDGHRGGTAAALLKYAPGWTGDDLDEVITIVKNTRTKTRF